MNNIIIQQITLDDVVKYDKERFNSNNHWENNIRPDDYEQRLEETNTKYWINNFRKGFKTIVINDPKHLRWMKECMEISSQTGKFSELFCDEMEEFLKEYEGIYNIDPNGNYFIRTENVSLKYGQHKTGPYNNLRMIVESLVSSMCGHTPIKDNTDEIVLYLLPFIEIEEHTEFRVFVCGKKITAISQQNLYSNVFKNVEKCEGIINKYIQTILEYFESNIKNSLPYSDYTYDFAIVGRKCEPFFIEPNSFGKEYAAGSALFHWERDYDILYGIENDKKMNKVYFRYVV